MPAVYPVAQSLVGLWTQVDNGWSWTLSDVSKRMRTRIDGFLGQDQKNQGLELEQQGAHQENQGAVPDQNQPRGLQGAVRRVSSMPLVT